MRKSLRSTLVAGALAVAALAVGDGGAQELGRLFTTPSERQQLDARKRDGGAGPRPTERPQAVAREVHDRFALQGLAVRHDGEGIAWFDGRLVRVGEWIGDSGARLATVNRDGVAIRFAKSGKEVFLQPGQHWEASHGVGHTRTAAPSAEADHGALP